MCLLHHIFQFVEAIPGMKNDPINLDNPPQLSIQPQIDLATEYQTMPLASRRHRKVTVDPSSVIRSPYAKTFNPTSKPKPTVETAAEAEARENLESAKLI